jgi:hypothetical protein
MRYKGLERTLDCSFTQLRLPGGKVYDDIMVKLPLQSQQDKSMTSP